MSRINRGKVRESLMANLGLKSKISLLLCLLLLFLYVWFSAGSGFGISQSSRLSSSVSAMRVLNTGSDVEEALADALVWKNCSTHTYLKKKKNTHTHNWRGCGGVCGGVCACLFVITNPWFYLCLMQSAFGRHAIQGQLLLLPVTCVLCVFF